MITCKTRRFDVYDDEVSDFSCVLHYDVINLVLVITLNVFESLQVAPGLSCLFAQDVVAVNTAEKQCCVVGELDKRAVLTPDVDSVLNSLADL